MVVAILDSQECQVSEGPAGAGPGRPVAAAVRRRGRSGIQLAGLLARAGGLLLLLLLVGAGGFAALTALAALRTVATVTAIT
ncbi:hypothetical protein, partial [Raoultella terrigena]|uniref:hypothetical protein n=1 Tax=Raoultella terrigena TaxID=577 RepID=UPI00132F70B7